jgi:hypothetical protein
MRVKADTHSSEGERGIEPKATCERCDSRVGVLARGGRVYVKADTRSSVKADTRSSVKADTRSSVGDWGIEPKTTRALGQPRVGILARRALCTCGPCSDPDEVEWFLPMLPASACTSGSSNIIRDLRSRGPSIEPPAQPIDEPR